MVSIFNSLKGILYFMSIIWTVWLLTKSWNTICFDIFDSYVTILTLGGSMVVNDMVHGQENKPVSS